MKFTLKGYQSEAVADVLVNLKKAQKRWHEDQDKHAFSLTATTGAGKTVMAAAVFEALFYGDDEYDIEPDPGAVVIWFSDSPALNEQSRFRLMEASDKLNLSDLKVVENTFSRERFEAGKVYFLNTQKLRQGGHLVRGHEHDDATLLNDAGQPIVPDGRSHTIWDTIQNTIEDPDLTLYLVLDEAHRGVGQAVQGRHTIVSNLINGHNGILGIPVVLGVSATVKRFDDAVKNMEKRTILPSVVVDPQKVQASGLLKDTINLDVPDEIGDFSTVLLRRGTEKLKEVSHAWKAYTAAQNLKENVIPLMVLQVPNTPDHNEIGNWIKTILDAWPELSSDCVAHVFGEHKTQNFGGFDVPYISPERVQDTEWVQVLIAKDAISTGWDCPRAEVMVSFRAAQDQTHITQLLGRMIRTPLARRIPGNETLNSVSCILPKFNKTRVEEVVNNFLAGVEGGDKLPGRRVLINPQVMLPNPDVPEEAWSKLVSLPSQTLPKKQAKPIKRLTILAHELAFDRLLSDAGMLAHSKMHKALNGAQEQYEEEIIAARNSVLKVEGKSLRADVASGEMSFNDFLERADMAVIEDAFKRASRILSPDLAKTYAEYLAVSIYDEEEMEDEIEALVEARTDIAALGLVADVKKRLEDEADKIANSWLTKYRVDIKSLKDERQEVYRQIQELSADPMDIDLARPKEALQPTVQVEADGSQTSLPVYEKHFLCNSEGQFPAQLNEWEKRVLKLEMEREGFVAWYRNPASSSQESLGIVYSENGDHKIVRPDFVFISRQGNGSIVADIVDPHGHHLADSLPKLKGLVEYSKKFGTHYRRIDAVSFWDDKLIVLDLKEEKIQTQVENAISAVELYKDFGATLL